MILLDDKCPPPPPYPVSVSPSRPNSDAINLSTLPPHILLHIVEVTFPSDSQVEAHRRNLYWLTVSLRLVCRGLSIGCMHVLRSTYLSPYLSLVKHPYTSDPFPLGHSENSGPSNSRTLPPIQSLQRETEVLDLFIALKAREDVWLDETDLHLEREESFKDLFALLQPRRRTEDLLRRYGVRYGVITLSEAISSPSAVPFSHLNISFSLRKVCLVLITPRTKSGSRQMTYTRTLVTECGRDRDERLEVVAKRLAKELVRWIADRR